MAFPSPSPTSFASSRTHSAHPSTAAVVAPYGTGTHYRDEFAKYGWECVAVTPPDDALPGLFCGSLVPADYPCVVVHDGSLGATADALRDRGVRAIVAGTEIGVPLAEQLAHRLGLPGNHPRFSPRRRDKGAMAAALVKAGIDGPRSLATGRLTEALSWAGMQDWPDFVLKPGDSAGSDGVHFCSSPDEIRAAWKILHQIPNAMGGSNSHLILQERLRGTQYVVNSVSAPAGGRARHTFTEFWVDRRVGTHLYDRMDLLQPTQMLPRLLARYTARVLDALGISVGPAHTEVMYVPERGPVLIECDACPEGSYDPAAMREVTGSDHIRDAVHAVITGTPDRLGAGRRRDFVTKVSLIATRDGALDEDRLRTLLALPTVRGYVGALAPGVAVSRTVDVLTSPGRVVLAADYAEDINEDYAAIRGLEASGLYGRTVR
jgi:biotin carboxylase